jgi:isopentenyl phosphate kinase
LKSRGRRSGREVVLVKLGGSLITDKAARDRARPAIVSRLAREIVDAAGRGRRRLILGHGGGSFGHFAARRFGLNRGALEPAQLAGVAVTQQSMARLHALVVAALTRAGGRPFSLAPSSFMTASAGRAALTRIDPLQLALEHALLPVVFGDVLLDRTWGASICSTEQVFLALVPRLQRAGWSVREVLWLGETAGVRDRDGTTIPRLRLADMARTLRQVGAPRGADVTGGMRHRLEAVARLARLGVPSRLVDGREPGLLARALAGRAVPGTHVTA